MSTGRSKIMIKNFQCHNQLIFLLSQRMSNHQQSLFDTEPAPWELDAQAQQLTATIVFSEGPDNEYDYVIPEEMQTGADPKNLLEPGRRVEVPFGRSNRRVLGYCIAIELKPVIGRKLKHVKRVLDPTILVSPQLMRLAQWMADYYLCPLGQVLDAIVPAGVRSQAGTREVTLLAVPTEIAARITQLKLPPKQQAAITMLAASPKPLSAAQLASRVGCTLGPINSLRKKGFVTETTARVDTGTLDSEAHQKSKTKLSLNSDQQVALDTIEAAMNSREHATILLHGVTGSGKTEVYIRAIEEAVSFGRQAIVLVPEISLTPQTVARFRDRFDSVAILHSHMSDVERHRHWQRIASGQVQVVVGARSAVFAPVPHLGLIIIDEEHESTFKQEVAPRYHAREVARQRAIGEQVPLVLGSATPALESWYRAKQGAFRLVEMPRRVLDLPMPAVGTINLQLEEHSRSNQGAISRPLHQAITQNLRNGGQVILLLNRRGHSTHIQCRKCAHVVECQHCDMPLTFHRQNNSAKCHYCDFETLAPTVCPECQQPGIRFSGLGTQKLEAEVRSRYSDFTCLRMDTDTMRRPGSHHEALSEFREGNAQILLGTQMIAKGLDFPNVTLVGVINADTALHLPDFRASERTFQLVTQVSGRTGRGKQGGHVLVQTLSPENTAILAATKHNYNLFAEEELAIREFTMNPPFASLVRIVLRGENEMNSRLATEELTKQLQSAASVDSTEIRIQGPSPAPMEKLRGQYRFHILLKSTDGNNLRELVRRSVEKYQLPDNVIITIDIDPVDMM